MTERGALDAPLVLSWELVPVATSVVYPVHVDAELDRPLSRWLWLVKWLLAIPHYVVLAFLWMAFVVVSFLAFFAILFTGRYPRSLFEFNVGVLRWSWRVAYYAYGALGTDRYPPFTLADVPDYPAHLSVEYPEHLSRGLVLVKWWLLAIPHYIIVGLFVGGGVTLGWAAEDWKVNTPGLIGILVLVAAVVLLFTGSYPRSLYDFVLGMNRWALRVAGYAGLMTDQYPPFRLDMGGPDPGALAVAPLGSSEPGAPPTPGTGGRWTAGRVVAVVIGAVLALTASGLLVAGFGTLWADRVARDADGYLASPVRTLSTGQYAVVSEQITMNTPDVSWALPDRWLGTVRLEATSTGGQGPLFVGVGPTADVSSYLSSVGYATVVNLTARTTTYREHAGAAPATPPGEATFWSASVSGTGTQTLSWKPQPGDWTLVVMNADGSQGVAVNAAIAATLPVLGWLWVVLVVSGLVLLAIGVLVIVLGVMSASRAPTPAGSS